MKRSTMMAAVLVAISLWWRVAGAEPPATPGDREFGKHDGPPEMGFMLRLPGPGGRVGRGPHVTMMGMGEGPGPMLPLILHRAGLTPEQQEKVRMILETDRQNLQGLFIRLEQANDQLSERLFSSGDLQLTDLGAQIEQVGDIRRSLMEQGIKTTLAIRAVLTPEQLARVNDLKRRMEELHAELRQLMEGDDSSPTAPAPGTRRFFGVVP